MTLNFPNASRSYDPEKHCVSFWGYDATFEIAFDLHEDALRRLNPQGRRDEASLLTVFDGNRGQIERVAGVAYNRQRKRYLRLSAADF